VDFLFEYGFPSAWYLFSRFFPSSFKFGYGQWEAVRMAIKRHPNFRFDYFLRSLPTELIGRRCEQLMKAAEKEVEQLEKRVREESGLATGEENNGNKDSVESDDLPCALPPVELPSFKVLRAQMRQRALREAAAKEKELEAKVEDIEEQIRNAQERFRVLNQYTRETEASSNVNTAEFPDELLPELANLLARSGATGVVVLANTFASKHLSKFSKKKICGKIEELAVKEKREEEGDTKAVWYIRQEHMHLLDADTLKFIRKAKEEKLQRSEKASSGDREHSNHDNGAPGPDGDFVEFPEYDGNEPPKEARKAFTHFCNGTRKQVKHSLPPEERRNKVSDSHYVV
jgi:SWI/SNF-related matrix-associated actin-dependent regulator of chromatin subfamily A member 5